MGPWRIFSLVAGVATLGKFCNLHKSKMAAIGRWQNVTFLSFNVETSVMPLCIFLTSEIHFRHRFCDSRSIEASDRKLDIKFLINFNCLLKMSYISNIH